MINLQPPEAPAHGDGLTLDVVSVFPTIQGEGPAAGTPATFIRLAGCQLQCPFCDTGYTKGRHHKSADALFLFARANGHRLVVLTGGEPFRQNVWPLCQLLVDGGFRVQIETNGGLWQDPHPGTDGRNVPADMMVEVVCSPKLPHVHEKLKPYVTALKYVLDAGHVGADGLPSRVLGNGCQIARPWEGYKGEVYVQPADSGDPVQDSNNVEAAVNSCLKYGYRLSLQTHKIIGLE